MLDARLEFQEREAEVFAAFNPYLLWWRQTREGRRRAGELGAGTDIVYRYWCRTDDFLRSIAVPRAAIPTYCRAGGYPNIASLTWRLRLHDREPVPSLSRAQIARQHWLRQDVYRGTLRILLKWISGQEAFTPQDHARHFWIRINDQYKIDVRNFRVDLLALCLMRWWMETPQTRSSEESSISRVGLKSDFPIAVSRFDFRQNCARLGWRAIFLATYASWYLRVLVAKQTGWLDAFVGFEHEEFARATSEVDGNGDRWGIGEVVFPSFADFDVLLSGYRKSLRYCSI